MNHAIRQSGTFNQPTMDASCVAAAQLAQMDAGRAAILALTRLRLVDGAAIRHLRSFGVGEGSLTRDEADAMFTIEQRDMAKVPEWDSFFIEAICDHVVWDLRPTGVVNEAQGEWLIAKADRANTPNAFAVLVNVLFVAHRVPMWFVAAVKARAARGWPGAEAARSMAEAEVSFL